MTVGTLLDILHFSRVQNNKMADRETLIEGRFDRRISVGARVLFRGLIRRFENVQRTFLDRFPEQTGTPSMCSFFLFKSPLPVGRQRSNCFPWPLRQAEPKHSGTNRAARFGSRYYFEGFGYRLSSVTWRRPLRRVSVVAFRKRRYLCFVNKMY